MPRTSIEWTDVSWPVVNGCRRTSPGCQRCYAERLAATRLRHTAKYKGLAVYGQNGPHWTGETRFWPPELTMPLRLRAHSRIFVADMGDLFYEGVPDHVIDRVLAVAAICAMREDGPPHVFQILTKRAGRMRRHMSASPEDMRARLRSLGAQLMDDGDRWWDHIAMHMPWPLPNVWLGVSVEDQEYADERIPHLLATPAAVRGVSYEPALGGVDFTRWMHRVSGSDLHMEIPEHPTESSLRRAEFIRRVARGESVRLDWIIVGGESGHDARPFDIAWARSVVQQCREAKVACFVKQLGAHPYESVSEASRGAGGVGLSLRDKKGGDPSEWPEDLRVRQWPEVRA